MTCWGKRNTGAQAPAWRGGKHFTTISGYVMVKAPGHPRATQRNQYVREHVLLMEELLGRYLLPGETVHHRNGIRHDNRAENLELWVTGQPSGQRVEDVVAWAREVIARYAPETVLHETER